jgi:hypothetical protein
VARSRAVGRLERQMMVMDRQCELFEQREPRAASAAYTNADSDLKEHDPTVHGNSRNVGLMDAQRLRQRGQPVDGQ